MTFNELVTKATELQAEILSLNEKFKELGQKLAETTLHKEMNEVQQELKNKTALYRAFTKETFGIADGEQMNVMDVAKAIKKVQALD